MASGQQPLARISAARRAFSPNFSITQRDTRCQLRSLTRYGTAGLGTLSRVLLVVPGGNRLAPTAGSPPCLGTNSMRRASECLRSDVVARVCAGRVNIVTHR